MLQAYATERAVASLGSECEIIDYYVNQDNTLFQRPTGLGSAAHDAHTALHYGPLKARYERFEAFSRENLNISGRRYQSLEELRQAELPYDVLLSGSDQIWNPKIFPTAGSTRCSSGPSPTSGRSPMPHPSASPASRTAWRRSCGPIWSPSPTCPSGSGQGQGIVRDITGKDVPVVLDPTLLLERTDWAAAPGTEARAGAISSAIASAAPTPWHPISAAWRRRRGCRWCSCAAYARRSTPRPAAFSAPVRRSFWVCSGMPPMCAPTPSTERCSPSSSKSPSLRRWHRQRWLRRRVPGPSAC